MDYENIFDENTIKALKSLAVGFQIKETTEEFVADENGEMKLTKRKVNEKNVPPNTDILKMLYMANKEEVAKYQDMTDEELEIERLRLLKELQQEENSK